MANLDTDLKDSESCMARSTIDRYVENSLEYVLSSHWSAPIANGDGVPIK